MSRTRIEWCDWTENPVKGLCPMACSYCYGRRLYQRFHWNPEIRYDPWALMNLPIKPSRIFVGSTMELFGPWVKPGYIEELQRGCGLWPQHTFIFLTKLPEKLPKEWPDNCWVGVTATDTESFMGACTLLEYPLQAKVKFLSLEPFLSWDYNWNYSYLANTLKRASIGWLIIGQQTPVRKSTMPKVEWIREIVDAADKAGVPVFCKDNLDCLIGQDQQFKRFRGYDSEGNMLVGLRQEFPEVKSHDQ